MVVTYLPGTRAYDALVWAHHQRWYIKHQRYTPAPYGPVRNVYPTAYAAWRVAANVGNPFAYGACVPHARVYAAFVAALRDKFGKPAAVVRGKGRHETKITYSTPLGDVELVWPWGAWYGKDVAGKTFVSMRSLARTLGIRPTLR